MSQTEICYMSAREMSQRIRAKQLSATEVTQAHLDQIARVNPKVNAVVTVAAEQAMTAAKQADAAIMRGDSLGALHGVPVAHKDLAETKGIRTTYGSPIYKDYVPDYDAIIVERQRRAGAITLGKTNTPEFGAGSQTFNAVFGATLNPYDLTKTCGGSSGGAAVALACGMTALADGSDMGGSLRNPAAFCNVVGLRPTPGRAPHLPNKGLWSTLSVDGPMARNVSDLALMLSVIAGADARAALALSDDPAVFAEPLNRNLKGARIAWMKDLPNMHVDTRVQGVVDSNRKVFESLGCRVDEDAPDFSEADDVFMKLRAHAFVQGRQKEYHNHKAQLKDTVIWNYEEGLKLSAEDVALAEVKRAQLWQRVQQFMERYDYLVLPVTQVPPFDVTQPFVDEINGIKMPNYIAWMKSCYYISVLGNPAISVPGGFTADGLPIGLQIVGRFRGELSLLQMAYAFEQATLHGARKPPVVNLP